MAGDRNGDKRKRKYRIDGRAIEGPGIWVTCVKGKEKQTVGEVYDLFTALADELWPVQTSENDPDEGSGDEELSIEAQVAKELAGITNKRPRTQQRFANCSTNTQCVIFISCRPPVDPVQLVVTHVDNVIKTGVTRTKFLQRLVPSTNTCVANPPEITSLCSRVFTPFFAKNEGKRYNLRVRNHTTLSRPVLIDLIAKCVPPGHTVSLDNAELFILVEVFKSVCGVGIVEDYYKHEKFNVMEIANGINGESSFLKNAGRVTDNEKESIKKVAA